MFEFLICCLQSSNKLLVTGIHFFVSFFGGLGILYTFFYSEFYEALLKDDPTKAFLIRTAAPPVVMSSLWYVLVPIVLPRFALEFCLNKIGLIRDLPKYKPHVD